LALVKKSAEWICFPKKIAAMYTKKTAAAQRSVINSVVEALEASNLGQ